jgi:uncharacterized protein YodC (DUF2158 family)
MAEETTSPDSARDQASEKPLSVGDTVRLRSGGPVMTVEKVRGDTVTCVWFDGKKAHDRKFLAAMLEPDDADASDEDIASAVAGDDISLREALLRKLRGE